jgi:hypothetical protein
LSIGIALNSGGCEVSGKRHFELLNVLIVLLRKVEGAQNLEVGVQTSLGHAGPCLLGRRLVLVGSVPYSELNALVPQVFPYRPGRGTDLLLFLQRSKRSHVL